MFCLQSTVLYVKLITTNTFVLTYFILLLAKKCYEDIEIKILKKDFT